MNLYNGDKKDSRKSSVISLLGKGSTSRIGKSQMFSRSMGGIVDRLKSLSRKDLAMVGVGLSVLVAAPVAEYMMSKPTSSGNMLTSGFSSRDTQGLSSLYEPGINALSQGSADGSGEVITPLSARDPSSLILGAQTEQPPMVEYASAGTNAGASTSSGPGDMDDMRDSVRDAARNSMSEAVKSAGAPTVIPRMQSAFRGLSYINSSGGSSSSGEGKRKQDILAAAKKTSGAKQSQMVSPVSAAGYKGASTPKSADKSPLEKLRAQGDAQSGYFSGASATKSLDNAAAVKMDDASAGSFGGSGFGGKSGGYKDGSSNGFKNSHKHSGECNTLECLAQKERQKKALEWESFLRYDIPKELIKSVLGGVTTMVGDIAKEASKKLTDKIFGDGDDKYVCVQTRVSGDCSKANWFSDIPATSDEKILDSWKTNKTCACGIMPQSDFNGKTPVAGGKPTTDVGNATDAEEELNKLLAQYDETMLNMFSDLAEVRKNNGNKKGIKHANAAVGYFEALPVRKVFAMVSNAAVTADGLVGESETAIAEANIALLESKNVYSGFKASLQKVLENPEAYTKAEDGKRTVETDDGSLKKLVQANMDKLNNVGEEYIFKKETVLQGYSKSLPIFKTNIANARKENSAVNDAFSTSLGVAKAIPLPLEDKNKQAVLNNFLEKMTKVGAGEPTNNDLNPLPDPMPVPDNLASATTLEGRILSAVASQDDAPVIKAQLWRGLEKDVTKDNYNTQADAAKVRENTSWSKDSPISNNTVKGDEWPGWETSSNTMMKGEFLAAGLRVVVEIPRDLKNIKQDVAMIPTNLEVVANTMNKIKESLAKVGIQFEASDNSGGTQDNGAGNNGGIDNNNTQPGTPVATKSVCADPKNCTRAEIAKAEAAAKNHAKYSKKNNSSVWNQYVDVNHNAAYVKAYADKNPEKYQEYNNLTGEIHSLRNEYDEAFAQYMNAEGTPAERAKAKEQMDIIEGKVGRVRTQANAIAEEIKKTNPYKPGGSTNNGSTTTPPAGNNNPNTGGNNNSGNNNNAGNNNDENKPDTAFTKNIYSLGLKEITKAIPAYDGYGRAIMTDKMICQGKIVYEEKTTYISSGFGPSVPTKVSVPVCKPGVPTSKQVSDWYSVKKGVLWGYNYGPLVKDVDKSGTPIFWIPRKYATTKSVIPQTGKQGKVQAWFDAVQYELVNGGTIDVNLKSDGPDGKLAKYTSENVKIVAGVKVNAGMVCEKEKSGWIVKSAYVLYDFGTLSSSETSSQTVGANIGVDIYGVKLGANYSQSMSTSVSKTQSNTTGQVPQSKVVGQACR